ncbi:hypothetical protein [Endozoicomonas sp. ALC020]|uniref:hypothetical protein n=1 Tax=Endozoicomonas sp. ALC020 TaxID=3403077 RepID=UPI003BB1C8AA
MKNACPSAFSLLVAVAVSSSIIAPKALADRRLQIRSVDIQANEQVEFVQSEVMVRPTLGDDQQPIPGSFTTTYPDQYGVSAGYIVPAIGFTDILSDFDGRVSSVDQFETDENNAALKYTKVLKLVDEGIFRFTHNLQEKELVIEVRVGMTDRDSVRAVRSQWTDMESLEPITKIASPRQLFALLKAVEERAGNLGTSDDYTTLATIEVDKVEVNGRTFMRLVSGGDQPPELERLSQSLFVNDDVLLAAATSAYIKVHVLGGELQQQALNKLLADSKPVGYVVHVEGHSRAYPVPAGYPKLEVAEAPGEVIVFHTQRLNPDDIAFVENLYDLWQEAKGTPPSSAILTAVKTYKVKSYQYVIRSRQMAMLEEFAAQHAAGESEDQPTTFSKKDKRAMHALAYYESLHLALATATPDEIHGINEFQVTQEHIRVALSVVTPNWMHNELAKHFSFKPALGDLLINKHFVRKIMNYIPVGAKLKFNTLYDDAHFFSKLLGERNRQMIKLFSKLDELDSEKAILLRFKRKLEIESNKADASDEKKLEVGRLYQEIKDKYARVLDEQRDQGNLHRELMQDVRRIPPLEKRVIKARIKTINARHSKMAIEPGIDDLDETQPLDEQIRRLLEKTDDTCRQAVVKTQLVQPHLQQEHTRTEAEIKARYATLAAHLEIQDFDSSADIDVQQECLVQKIKTITAEKKGLHQQLKAIADLEEEIDRRPAHPEIMSEALEKLTAVEKTLKMDGLKSEDDVYHRRNAISEKIHSYTTKAVEEAEQEALDVLETLEEILKIEVNKEDNKATRLARVRDRFHCDIPKYMLLEDGSFQYTPEQAEVLHAIQTFMQQHPLKRQALQVATGLAELAVMNGKAIPNLPTYDFDEEFAALRLQVLVGDKLTFDQTSRIVQIFREMKATFPECPASEDEPRCPLEEVQKLVHRARNEMGSGAREYDKEIFGMGKSAIHYLGRDPDDLKTFPEDFTTHSASVNRIITLLHEGLINKVELWNYIKTVRGIDGYQTVAEFEHFLGYKQGVNVPHFRAAVRLLSDKGVEKFILSAFPAVTATDPVAMKESVAGMKEYAAAVIANYVLDDIAFDNGRRTAAFLANIQNTLTSYAHAAGLSESELIKAVHGTLMQVHTTAVEQQINEYWVKPSAFLVQAVTWYFSSYKPLLATRTAGQAAEQSLLNMSFLYLLDLTNRGDYLHRMLAPFQHWLEGYSVDLDRTGQYVYHSGIEKVSEVGGLAMPLGKAASSVILLRTGSMLFARQYNANPQMYRSISRLVPEIMKSTGSGQGVQVPLLHRATPQKVKTLASATASLVLGPVATVGAYVHGLISGFSYAQTFGFALASSLTFDFFMNDNKMLTQWLGGPLGRSLDRINRWIGVGETQDEYLKRTAITSPQRFGENDEEYASRVKANNTLYGWTRYENYLQFRERRDRTMKLFENGWEKYFRENVPKWSFSHAESIPYFYTLGVFYK